MSTQILRALSAHAPIKQRRAIHNSRDTAAVKSFYTDVLEGQQVWPHSRAHAARSLWFLIGTALLEVTGTDPLPVRVEVESPDAVAERCWDAGFEVIVRDDGYGAAVLSVIDPIGRQIHLAPCVQALHASASSA